jgi:hypothetical protein
MKEFICPHCKKPINDPDALLCLYCGESLERGSGFISNLKYPSMRAVSIIVILLLIAVFLLWVIV